MSQDTPQPKLPQNIFLHGEEAFYEDFSLSAEEAMEMLQIKRTRLRDISGHELRVGRKRDGRYIRPFYRLQDIESYKEKQQQRHSRQGASAQLISNYFASHEESVSQQLEADLGEVSQQLQSHLRRQISQIYPYIQQQQQQTQKSLQQQLTAMEIRTHQRLSTQTQHQLDHQQAIVNLHAQVDSLQAMITDITVEQQVLKKHLLENRHLLTTLQDSITQLCQHKTTTRPQPPAKHPKAMAKQRTRRQAKTPPLPGKPPRFRRQAKRTRSLRNLRPNHNGDFANMNNNVFTIN